MLRLILAVGSLIYLTSSQLKAAEPLAPPNHAALAIAPGAPEGAGTYAGPSYAIVRNLVSGTTSTFPLQNDDVSLPVNTPNPMNSVLIEPPVVPPDTSFARIEFNNGTSYCSATAIGRRLFLTAGHCIADEKTHEIKQNAIVYVGFPRNDESLRFKAVKFAAFSGWTTVSDWSHDVALVEVDRDLPAYIRTYSIVDDVPRCSSPHGFVQTYYQGTLPLQLRLSAAHIGCQGNMLMWDPGTTEGSSGSAAVNSGTTVIYGVYSMYTKTPRRGYHAWITRAKHCFIRSQFMGEVCNVPPGLAEPLLVPVSLHVDALNSAGLIQIPVYRTGSNSGQLSLRYLTASGSAQYGRDLEPKEELLTWASGDMSPRYIRVVLHPENDPVCVRKFRILFQRRVGDPPSPTLSNGDINISIYSSALPVSKRRLLVHQFQPLFKNGGILAENFVISEDALYASSPYDLFGFWRDRSTGISLFHQAIHDGQNALSFAPVISFDGSYITRPSHPAMKTYTKGVGNPQLTESSSVPFDYDRYTTRDATSSNDARSDLYVSSNNSTTGKSGILRYERDFDTGRLFNKQGIWSGDGGMPDGPFLKIQTSGDGKWLFAIEPRRSIATFKRDASTGLLQFLSSSGDVFDGWDPIRMETSKDSKYLLVAAGTDGGLGTLFAFAISATGSLTQVSQLLLPSTPVDLAMNPDGIEADILVNTPHFRIVQATIDPTNGALQQIGDFSPHACETNPELAIPGRSLAIGPEGNFISVATGDKGLLTLRLDR